MWIEPVWNGHSCPLPLTLILILTPSRRQPKNANGPGISEAVATANNSFPAKVTLLLSKESGCKSSYFKEGRTLPYEPSTAPERHPPSKRNGPGGTRTLTCTLARNCAAVTPQTHGYRAYIRKSQNLGSQIAFSKIRVFFRENRRMCFQLESPGSGVVLSPIAISSWEQ